MSSISIREAFAQAVWVTDWTGALITKFADPCDYGDGQPGSEFNGRISLVHDSYEVECDNLDLGNPMRDERETTGSTTVDEAKAAILSWLSHWEDCAIEYSLQQEEEDDPPLRDIHEINPDFKPEAFQRAMIGTPQTYGPDEEAF